MNKVFTDLIPRYYGKTHEFMLADGEPSPIVTEVGKVTAIWAVEAALLLGILTVFALAWRPVIDEVRRGQQGGGGRRAAGLDEHRLGIRLRRGDRRAAGLPRHRRALKAIPNPLVNEAVTVTALAGITGSASGGMSIALAAMADTFIANANAAGIPLEVLHRVASMASGGMDTLPHNGAVITLLAVTGLTHRQSYKDIFAITLIKTAAVFVVIGVYYATGLV